MSAKQNKTKNAPNRGNQTVSITTLVTFTLPVSLDSLEEKI